MNYRNAIVLLLGIIASSSICGGVEIEELLPTKISDNDHRSLQLCGVGYEYEVQIRDDLRMSYVVISDRIKVELVYDGEAWIGLGTNPGRDGRMVGSEAWVALPGVSIPISYDLNGKLQSRIRPTAEQTLENGEVTQTDGSTVLKFDKLLTDGDNVAIDGNGDVVFIWAIGRGNSFGRHRQRGAFRLDLEPCTVPPLTTTEVELDVVCGFLGLSLFCPLSGCGFFGRLVGLC